MSEKIPTLPEVQIKEEYKGDFLLLQKIWTILASMGLRTCEHTPEVVEEMWDDRCTFPISREGGDGVRVTRNRKGGLIVHFTNGLEEPSDPKRIEITQELRKNGIEVV